MVSAKLKRGFIKALYNATRASKGNRYKGDENLLAVIRRQKHKSKRAHARTHVRNYYFESDWLI